jgi:hypothetical protein
MPDHIHLLITPQAITLERTMQLIKGGFSHRIATKLPVWQRGFTDHRIRDADDFNTRRTYIHQNPVRASLVPSAELYPSLLRLQAILSIAENSCNQNPTGNIFTKPVTSSAFRNK